MKVIKNVAPYLVVALVTVFFYYVILEFNTWDINVPIDFSGDAITDGGTLTLAKKAIRGDGILSVKSFWTIDGDSTAWGIIDASIHYYIMCFLALFIDSVGCLTNIYFILTFVLCGCFMYYALSRLGTNKFLAIAIGVIYAFVPGHLQRGIGHLAIGSCFSLPLLILGCVYLITDQIGYKPKKIIIIGKHEIALDLRLIEGIIGAILVGFSSIYFCTFAMIVHTICIFICAINRNRRGSISGLGFLFFDFLSAFFTVVLPNIISAGDAVASYGNTRRISDIDAFSLKIAQLILPINGHRIPLFSALRRAYASAFGENENANSSLGMILSISLLLSIVFVFVSQKKSDNQNKVSQIGKANLLILLISVAGGGAEIIGLVYSPIRCYNRMSFIIASFSCFALAYLINSFVSKRKIIVQIIFCSCFMLLAILDQSSNDWKYSSEYAKLQAKTWYAEEIFFEKIEETGADTVLIYPSKYSSKYKDVIEDKYKTMKSYIHTDDDITFTTGYAEKSSTDLWIKTLENYSDDEKMRILAAEGFDGILLYKDGFKDEEYFYEFYKSMITLNGETKVISSEDGLWYYIPISKNYFSHLLYYDIVELNKLCDLIGSNKFELGRKYCFGLSEVEPFIQNGFSGAEVDFRWSSDSKSEMNFEINEESFGDLEVNIRYLYLYDKQQVEIFANGQSVFDDLLTDNNGIITFTVPRNDLKENELELLITYSDAKSPASEGLSADVRELAIAWQDIQIVDTGINSKNNLAYVDFSILDKYLGR